MSLNIPIFPVHGMFAFQFVINARACFDYRDWLTKEQLRISKSYLRDTWNLELGLWTSSRFCSQIFSIYFASHSLNDPYLLIRFFLHFIWLLFITEVVDIIQLGQVSWVTVLIEQLYRDRSKQFHQLRIRNQANQLVE